MGHNGTNDTISVRLPAIAFGSGGGGTGLTTVATSGQFTGDGTVADPIFIDAVSAHLITSGTLNTGRLPVVPIDKGGTGATNGTTALSNLGAGTAAERDVGAVSGNLAALDAGGRIPTARLASGTADNTRFLRGDQTWSVPAGGGGGSGTPSDAQPANVTGTSAAGTDSDYSRGDHAHTVDLDTTMAFTSGVLGVNVHDVIEHLSEHIRYFTNSSSFPNAEATVGQAYNTSDFQKNISHIKATFLVPSGGANYVARILRVSGGNQVLEVLGTSAQITPHGEVEGRTFRFTDSGNDVGVALAPNVRIAIVISRLGSGGSAASLAINGSQASASPDKTYDDADMDFVLANDVVYQHENPGVGTNTHTHGSDIRANIGIYYNLSYNHGSLVGGTIVTANPTGTDGDDLTRIAIDGTNYVIPAGGGTAFDIHDDVAVQSTVADADRFVFSDEGSAGDPMKYVTATNLATYMEQEVSLDAARITSGAFSTVRIANNAITTAKIAAEAITHTKMGADSVDGDNVANNTLGPANFHADNSAGFDNIWAIEGPADMASGHWFSPADFRVHIGADQGSAFDIHGDVLTAATITDADHLVFSDESVTGEPMRYTSAGNLAIYLNGVIQLTASQITSGAFLTARIPDLSATKITTGTFHQQRVPGLPASRISSGMLGRDRLGAGIDILGDVTKYLRGDSTWAVPPSTFDIHDGVTTLATPANSDRLVFSDENVTGDPMRYATIGHLVSHVATNVFLNTSRITAGILDTDRMGSGTATSTTYLRGDSTWAIPAGGADFDLHDDVTNSATVVDADRFVFSDESTAGDPMRYTTAANFADYLQQEVSLNADRLTSGVISTARLASGTASSATFLRGDRTWSAPGGGATAERLMRQEIWSADEGVGSYRHVCGRRFLIVAIGATRLQYKRRYGAIRIRRWLCVSETCHLQTNTSLHALNRQLSLLNSSTILLLWRRMARIGWDNPVMRLTPPSADASTYIYALCRRSDAPLAAMCYPVAQKARSHGTDRGIEGGGGDAHARARGRAGGDGDLPLGGCAGRERRGGRRSDGGDRPQAGDDHAGGEPEGGGASAMPGPGGEGGEPLMPELLRIAFGNIHEPWGVCNGGSSSQRSTYPARLATIEALSARGPRAFRDSRRHTLPTVPISATR